MKPYWIALLFLLASFHATAEVSHASDIGFVSEHVLELLGSPQAAYQALTLDIHQWWDATHSYSNDAKNFSLDPQAGGCFCERLTNGGNVEHMRVVFANPGKELRLLGSLGPLQEMAVSGSMVFKLEAVTDELTKLHYRYSVGGYVPGGLQSIANPVDQVQLGQLLRLQHYLATGSPTTE